MKISKICWNVSRYNGVYIDQSHQIYLPVLFTIPEEYWLKL